MNVNNSTSQFPKSYKYYVELTSMEQGSLGVRDHCQKINSINQSESRGGAMLQVHKCTSDWNAEKPHISDSN